MAVGAPAICCHGSMILRLLESFAKLS